MQMRVGLDTQNLAGRARARDSRHPCLSFFLDRTPSKEKNPPRRIHRKKLHRRRPFASSAAERSPPPPPGRLLRPDHRRLRSPRGASRGARRRPRAGAHPARPPASASSSTHRKLLLPPAQICSVVQGKFIPPFLGC